MDIINDLNRMKEMMDKLPPMPRHIEATHYMYTVLKERSDLNKLIYGESKYNPLGFEGVTLWVASEEEQDKWTEEEKRKQFKVVY